MADKKYPAAPQEFSFNGRRLLGFTLSFTSLVPRRSVTHEFLKRRGGRVEDMERGPRKLEVQLVFTGDNAANDCTGFEAEIDARPTALLVHPQAGKFQAFCTGDSTSVTFATATNAVMCKVSFTESELDAQLPRETPDVATAAQQASTLVTTLQTGVAQYMAVLAKGQIFQTQALNAIEAVATTIEFAPNPIDSMLATISTAAGTVSTILAPMQAIAASAGALVSTATAYISAATDVFDGTDVQAGQSTAIATLLGNTTVAAEALTDALIAASITPAGAAEVVGINEETLAACLLLSDAVAAARPPVIPFIVPEIIDVITLAQRRYGKDAAARASEILSLNKIHNPAAIPAGTQLLIPSR
jgi:prophage DNA circulation protein